MSQAIGRLKELSIREQALVLIGVLLDAENAARYLSADKQRGTALAAAAEECAGLDADLSVPLCGTLLRDVLEQMKDTYAVRSDASESDDGQE